jgi:NitT/TauT family transport system permease protein
MMREMSVVRDDGTAPRAAICSLSRFAGEGRGGGRGGEAIAGVVQGRESASPSPPSPPQAGEGDDRPREREVIYMSRTTLILLQAAVAVIAVGLWYVLSTYEIFGTMVLPPFFFSTPLDVADRIVSLFARGIIWKHLWVTLSESMLAFVIGSAAGVLVGFWFARQPVIAAVLDPYVKMINALPRVVLAPIFTLWFGLGIWSKVALGVTLVFFIVFFNVYQGVREVSPTVLANARMLGMNERALLRHVYWPSALSWMFSSLHTAVGFAVVGAVVGEYLGSAAGLGYLIQQAEGVFDVAGVFAGMFILAVFVLIIDAAVSRVEKRLLAWRPVADARH